MSGTTPAHRARWRAERRVTPLQRRILAWLLDRTAEWGRCPTSGEVRDGLQLGLSSWQEHLTALERAGLIRRRSIEVVAQARPGRSGGGLSAEEVVWCHVHAERVRALRSVVEGDAGDRRAA